MTEVNWPSGEARRGGFTLVELLVVIAIIGLLMGLLLPAIQAARAAARRTKCANNLRQLGLGMQSYHAQHQAFPPGAKIHQDDNVNAISWRVILLPYVEQAALYDKISPDRYGGADHWEAKLQVLEGLVCPEVDPPNNNDTSTAKASSYSSIAGAGRNDERIVLPDPQCGDVDTDGVLYPGSKVRAGQVVDGTSNTLLLGERLYVWRDWMTGSNKTGDPPTRLCSGSTNNVHFPINADPEQFGYFKGDASVPVGQRTMYLNELQFGSEHVGGAHFCYADGSTHFVSEDINFVTYQDMATRDGGETGSASP